MYVFSSIQFCHLCRLLYHSKDTEQFHTTRLPPCCPFITIPTSPPGLHSHPQFLAATNLSTISKILSFKNTLIQFLKQQPNTPLGVKAQHHCSPAAVRRMGPGHCRGKRKPCPTAQNSINQNKGHIQEIKFSTWRPLGRPLTSILKGPASRSWTRYTESAMCSLLSLKGMGPICKNTVIEGNTAGNPSDVPSVLRQWLGNCWFWEYKWAGHTLSLKSRAARTAGTYADLYSQRRGVNNTL